jgi:exopolysaccharide production protein ExoZ
LAQLAAKFHRAHDTARGRIKPFVSEIALLAAMIASTAPLPTERSAARKAGGEATLWTIQYLRGAAALAVVAYHALQWCDGGFDVGRAGVDVFFVISGVIMWRITSRLDTAPFAFLWRRFTRVAPLYWLATLLVAAIAQVWSGFLPEVRPGLAHMLLSLAFIPHLDPRGLPFPTLPPGWTLDYEMIFYVVFALALALPASARARARLTAGILFGLVALGFLFPTTGYFMGANPMLLQFAAGLWLGVLMTDGRLPSRAWGFGLMGGAVLLWGLVQMGGLFSELWRPLMWGIPAGLTVLGALAIDAGTRSAPHDGPTHRSLMALGNSSYCLYLFHLPATAVIAHVFGYQKPWLFLPLALIASILAGLAAHLWLEKPLLAALRRRAPQRLRAI